MATDLTESTIHDTFLQYYHKWCEEQWIDEKQNIEKCLSDELPRPLVVKEAMKSWAFGRTSASGETVKRLLTELLLVSVIYYEGPTIRYEYLDVQKVKDTVKELQQKITNEIRKLSVEND